jgi:hypothetical protein
VSSTRPIRGTQTVMSVWVPPPGPGESPVGEPADTLIPAPATVFARGIPSPEAERLADAIVAARPGLLFVVTLD